MENRTHYVGKTLSRQNRTKENTTSPSRKALMNTQEEVLVAYLNKLTARGLPPTPQIIKNLAEAIANTELNSN